MRQRPNLSASAENPPTHTHTNSSPTRQTLRNVQEQTHRKQTSLLSKGSVKSTKMGNFLNERINSMEKVKDKTKVYEARQWRDKQTKSFYNYSRLARVAKRLQADSGPSSEIRKRSCGSGVFYIQVPNNFIDRCLLFIKTEQGKKSSPRYPAQQTRTIVCFISFLRLLER